MVNGIDLRQRPAAVVHRDGHSRRDHRRDLERHTGDRGRRSSGPSWRMPPATTSSGSPPASRRGGPTPSWLVPTACTGWPTRSAPRSRSRPARHPTSRRPRPKAQGAQADGPGQDRRPRQAGRHARSQGAHGLGLERTPRRPCRPGTRPERPSFQEEGALTRQRNVTNAKSRVRASSGPGRPNAPDHALRRELQFSPDSPLRRRGRGSRPGSSVCWPVSARLRRRPFVELSCIV